MAGQSTCEIERASRRHLATVYEPGFMKHIDDGDLERYCLGLVTAESELASIEEHLLWCPHCLDRAEASDRFVDAIRAARGSEGTSIDEAETRGVEVAASLRDPSVLWHGGRGRCFFALHHPGG